MAGNATDNKDTTTTTTVEDDSTTTTTVAEDTTTTTTSDVPTSDTSVHAKDGTEAQPTGGETVIDQNADATVLGGNGDVHKTDAESAEANIEAGKQQALENHAADHKDDHLDGRSQPFSV